MTYPYSHKPEDIWAAKMNDALKTNYALDVHYYGKYPGYYMNYLKKCDLVPTMLPEDKEIMKSAKMDFIAFNYYRTLCARYLPEDENHPLGTRTDSIDYDMYGYWKIEKMIISKQQNMVHKLILWDYVLF